MKAVSLPGGAECEVHRQCYVHNIINGEFKWSGQLTARLASWLSGDFELVSAQTAFG